MARNTGRMDQQPLFGEETFGKRSPQSEIEMLDVLWKPAFHSFRGGMRPRGGRKRMLEEELSGFRQADPVSSLLLGAVHRLVRKPEQVAFRLRVVREGRDAE